MANTKATTKKTTTKETISKKEYEDMQKHMKEMEEMIAKLTQVNPQPSNIQYITNVNENNKDVTLTSLTVGELNLSTEGYGQGVVYTFHQYGEEQTIPYDDLKKIIRNNKKFIEGGNVFINDEEVVESQRLTNVYKKLLSYEQMNKIFEEDRKTFEKIFKNMTKNQKETLRGIIFDKLEKDVKSVDMNIVQILNDDMGIDIMSDFKNKQELFKNIDK